MAKRRPRQDPEPKQDEIETMELEDPTVPAIDTSAMIAAHDQFEAAKAGEANSPPSKIELSIEDSPVVPPPADALPAIPLKVFVKIAGPKWDQMAGFISYAKVKNLGPRTVPAWRATHQAFLQKPVK